MTPGPLTVAQVTPYSWGTDVDVNHFVERVSDELCARGHRVVIAAPSDSATRIRESRRRIRAARTDWRALFQDAGRGPLVLALGAAVPLPRSPGSGRVSVPIDVNRTLEHLLGAVPFDVVHVHEPFPPSASNAALRHSRALNVGSFHDPHERILSTQMARPLVEIFLGRLDARTVSYGLTGELLDRAFPGEDELVAPGADPPSSPGERTHGEGPHLVFLAREERGALRVFLRGLRRLPLDAEWHATVWSPRPDDGAIRLNKRLRERVRVAGPGEDPELLTASADVLGLASGGARTAPDVLREALVAGAVPVVSAIGVYEELVADGERGLVFPVGDHLTLAAQLERALVDPDLRKGLRDHAAGSIPTWAAVAERVEGIYQRICARRHEPRSDPAVRRRLARRKVVECDLHMHTDHSHDCATPVRTLLETARDRGLGAIAITDHNVISGALEARELAEEVGIGVIVGEEIKTAGEGEVIGLFLEEEIPRGMTMRETIDAIRAQGGLVYVPHPFDRLHTVPDYEHLLGIVEDIDILEVFNPRVAFSAFNEEAVRFADKYRIVAGAGSDAHVAQAMGSVRIRLHAFEGPEEFLEAMRDADIVHKHRNLVYVQALKWLQTSPPGRRAQAGRPTGPVRGGRPRGSRRAARRAGR